MSQRTGLVDLDQIDRALTALGNMNLSGPITYCMIHNVIQGVRAALITTEQTAPAKEEPCRSDTPQKNSSRKSATEE